MEAIPFATSIGNRAPSNLWLTRLGIVGRMRSSPIRFLPDSSRRALGLHASELPKASRLPVSENPTLQVCRKLHRVCPASSLATSKPWSSSLSRDLQSRRALDETVNFFIEEPAARKLQPIDAGERLQERQRIRR
jgi:hypothetical protein